MGTVKNSKQIKAYRASWNFAHKIGSVKFQFKGQMGWTEWQRFEDKTEYGIILSILQNEKEVFYSQGSKTGNWILHTGVESPGE